MDIQKSLNKAKAKVLREYLSGVPVELLVKRYGYSRATILTMSEDFRDGKLDIFVEQTRNRLMKEYESREEELKRLKMENELLKNDLKMANITIEGYEIMQRICKEEYGIDLSKKPGAGSSKSLKKSTKK